MGALLTRGREAVIRLSFYANGYLAGKVGCYSYEAISPIL